MSESRWTNRFLFYWPSASSRSSQSPGFAERLAAHLAMSGFERRLLERFAFTDEQARGLRSAMETYLITRDRSEAKADLLRAGFSSEMADRLSRSMADGPRKLRRASGPSHTEPAPIGE